MQGVLPVLMGMPAYTLTKKRFDSVIVRADAWFLVFIAVVLGLAATLFMGLTIWCLVYQHKRFTGNWYWKNGWQVAVECR